MRQTILTSGFVVLAVLASACSSEDTGGDPDPMGSGGSSGSGGLSGTGGDPSMMSPNGLPYCGSDPATQPDRCEDEKGAIRCKVDTGYPGDELALCEPDPEDGMLIHFGPQDYSDPDNVAPFILTPQAAEEEFCLRVNTPNTEEKWFNEYHGRLRPNSHHLIVTMPGEHTETETVPWQCGPQILDRWLFGSQDPNIDVQPEDNMPGDPDYGVAHDVPPNQTLLLDFHNVNPTPEPTLREAWTVVNYVPEEEVLVKSDLVGFYQLSISIPPLGAATTGRKTCSSPAETPVYLSVATVHAHQRLTRGSLWHNKLDGTSELIYESRDWAEPGNAGYTRGVDNPDSPLAPGQRWGAKDGYVQVMPGESMSFECEFQNDKDEWVSFGETTGQEMCNIFGLYYPTVGGMWNCLL